MGPRPAAPSKRLMRDQASSNIAQMRDDIAQLRISASKSLEKKTVQKISSN
jgi:hypothetical protein